MLALSAQQKNCVQRGGIRWEFKSSQWCDDGMRCSRNCFAARKFVCFGFFRGIQDTCVGRMVFFMLWLMTLEESTFKVSSISF